MEIPPGKPENSVETRRALWQFHGAFRVEFHMRYKTGTSKMQDRQIYC